MNRPNAANTSEPSQAISAATIQAVAGMSAPPNAPATNTQATEIAPMTMAVSSLMPTYATGVSGVSRSWRDQPTARSTATEAPALVVAIIAPYTARLIIT